MSADPQVLAAFRRRKRRMIAVALVGGVVMLAALGAIYVASGGHYAYVMWVVPLAGLPVLLPLSRRIWRCPACEVPFRPGSDPEACPRCGAAFRG